MTEEGMLEPADVQAICEQPTKFISELAENPDMFEGLTLGEQKRIQKAMKRANPTPELKADHRWLQEFIKETIDAHDADITERGIEQVTAAQTPEELAAAAKQIVQESAGQEAVDQIEQPAPDPQPTLEVIEADVVDIVAFIDQKLAEIAARPNKTTWSNGMRAAYKQVRKLLVPPAE